MPMKRKSKRRMPMRGNGFFGDVWDGIKSAAGRINDMLKSTKILSTVAGAIPQTLAGAPILSTLGYGKRRRGMGGRGGQWSSGASPGILKF